MPGPLADLAQLAARLGVSFDPESAAGVRGQAALEDASALIRSEGAAWEDPGTAPEIAVTICLASAMRAFSNPNGVSQASVGDVAVSFSGSSGGSVYLLRAELRSIRKAAGVSGAGSINMTSDLGLPNPRYAPTQGDDIPLGPWPWEED